MRMFEGNWSGGKPCPNANILTNITPTESSDNS